jgi:hypothetical protein
MHKPKCSFMCIHKFTIALPMLYTHINITNVSFSQLTSQKYPRTSMSHAHDPKAFITCLTIEVKTCCQRKLTQNWDQTSKPMYLSFNYFMCFFLLPWFHQTRSPKFKKSTPTCSYTSIKVCSINLCFLVVIKKSVLKHRLFSINPKT